MTSSEVILQLEKVKKRYKVTTNQDEYIFSEDTVLKFLLFQNKTLSKQELEEINSYENKLKVFDKCINYLSYNARSIYEIRIYLKKLKETNGFDYNLINEIINRLIELGYLDDEAYAKIKLDYAIRNFKGPKYLESLLKEKRISKEIIKAVLANYSPEIETENITEIVDKLKNKNQDEPVIKQKQKLIDKLLRSGFNYSLINDVVNQVEFIDNSKEVLEKEIAKLTRKYCELDDRERKKKIIEKLLSKSYNYRDITEAFMKIE